MRFAFPTYARRASYDSVWMAQVAGAVRNP